jgi:hypothetical protein
MVMKMKKDKGIDKGNNCDVRGCGCNANYLFLGIAVILVVMFVAASIK